MEKLIIIEMNDEDIRFTPDGRVSVIDAIKVVAGSTHARKIWEKLKLEHPDVLLHCENLPRNKDKRGDVCFVDSEGWEKILLLLPSYVYLRM